MIVPDVNVLVYAHRGDAPDHARYRRWLEDLARGDAAFGLSELVLSGFLRVVTHPRIFTPPSPSSASLQDHPAPERADSAHRQLEVRPTREGVSLPAGRLSSPQQTLARSWWPCPTCYPTRMQKTSVYLDAADVERLRRLASREGRSRAEIIRLAIAAYEGRLQRDRHLALTGAWTGDGTSVADVPERELLEGFGR